MTFHTLPLNGAVTPGRIARAVVQVYLPCEFCGQRTHTVTPRRVSSVATPMVTFLMDACDACYADVVARGYGA